MKRFLIVTGFAVGLATGPAFAQDGEDTTDALDQTVALMPESAESADAVTGRIELPKDENGEFIASVEGVEHSARGLETANLAREDGRAFSEAAASAAQQNREDYGRGSTPDLGTLLPDQAPDVPDRPETLSPPAQ